MSAMLISRVSESELPMEFHDKLQELRKQKGLTQEELAQALFVSRTAISKWESGRGYPNIESLKAIAKFYCVSIDELLSGDEVLILAQENQKRNDDHARDLMFGLLDLSMALLLFLPLFGQEMDGIVREVSLLALDGGNPFLRLSYFAMVIIMALWGVLVLAMQNCQLPAWVRCKSVISAVCGALTVVLFVISRQAYAAIFVFIFLMIKVLFLVKKP